MSEMLEMLTEKERETLRLMGRGHDAKSMARQLGLSVHTINERLRAARRKLSVSSSREAARLLIDSEGATPKSFVDKPLGEAEAPRPAADGTATIGGRTSRTPWILAGVLSMSVFIAIAALALQPQSAATPSTTPVEPAATSQVHADVTRAANDWLALVDAGRWDDSWRATGTAFRRANTTQVWAATSEQVRAPLGATLTRNTVAHDRVFAPPNGYEVIKFETRFANRPRAIETVTLEREGDAWKVVGYSID